MKSYRHTLLTFAAITGVTASCQPSTVSPPPLGPSPTASSSTAPNPEPLPPSPSASPASPTPQPSPSVATIRVSGVVKNDDGVTVPGITVTLSDAQGQTMQTTTTDGVGVYTFDQVPQNKQITVSLSSNSYGPRSQNYVTTDVPLTLDFVGSLAITNRPEVTKVTPANGATGVDGSLPIVLVFSTGMDKASVEAAFALQLNSDSPVSLPTSFLLPGGSWPPTSTTAVMDITSFESSWLGATTITLTPKTPIPAPPGGPGTGYRLTLSYNSHVIRASGGREALPGVVGDVNTGAFRFGASSPYTTFSVSPPTNSGSMRIVGTRINGSIIRLQYSKPLFQDIAAGRIAGGNSGSTNDAPAAVGTVSGVQAAANYEIQVNGGGYQAFTPTNFAGATAYFDNSDSTRQTVMLQTDAPVAAAGDVVDIRVINPVMNAQGERLNLNNSANMGKATAAS